MITAPGFTLPLGMQVRSPVDSGGAPLQPVDAAAAGSLPTAGSAATIESPSDGVDPGSG